MKFPEIKKHWQKAIIIGATALGAAFIAANWDDVEDVFDACKGQVTNAMRQMP